MKKIDSNLIPDTICMNLLRKMQLSEDPSEKTKFYLQICFYVVAFARIKGHSFRCKLRDLAFEIIYIENFHSIKDPPWNEEVEALFYENLSSKIIN